MWFYDMKADGFSLDDKRVVVSENDITDIIKRFKNREQEIDRKRTEQSFMVPKQEIADNGYDLSINKYKQVEYEKIEYPATSEILANIKALDKEIAKEMEELKAMVNEIVHFVRYSSAKTITVETPEEKDGEDKKTKKEREKGKGKV